MKMKQVLFSFTVILHLFPFYCTTSLAQSPAAAPKAPTKPVSASPAPTKPLVPALPADTPDSSTQDVIGILKKAKSFKVLIRLLKSTQMINQINSQLITSKNGGLTILAPDDNAFSQLKTGYLNSLADGQKIELLQFHVLPVYASSSNFDSLSNPVTTLAGDNPTRLPLEVVAYGNNVNISTGVVNATLRGAVYSDKQLAIYQLDKVLLPLDFFKPKAPAPSPALATAPKADKDNSSTEDQHVTAKDSSGAITLISTQATTLLSLGVALAAMVAISS